MSGPQNLKHLSWKTLHGKMKKLKCEKVSLSKDHKNFISTQRRSRSSVDDLFQNWKYDIFIKTLYLYVFIIWNLFVFFIYVFPDMKINIPRFTHKSWLAFPALRGAYKHVQVSKIISFSIYSNNHQTHWLYNLHIIWQFKDCIYSLCEY